MTEFNADALTEIGDHLGECLISAAKEALSILDPQDHSVIATWQYSHIRKFRAEPGDNLFIFKSGSHGPFGVKEYQFELTKTDLSELQSLITDNTGAHFNTKSPRHNTKASVDESPQHYNKPSAVEVAVTPPVDSELEASFRNPVSPSLTNPQAALERVKALAQSYEPSEGGDEGKRKSRMNVYEELVKTERDYVDHLKTVIDAYYDAMDPESMSIPLRLRGKREVVFGNLQDIYKFHEGVFCEAVEFFKECPERVGDCFMHFAAEFELYTVYCKNHSKSELLVNEGTECQAFFKGIQRKLGHPLDLGSYLLKPVQRITKYQLLLKDLLKHSAELKNAVGELEAAYNKMCKILKDLNDSMHSAGLTGLPDDLPEPGKLLAHDPFQVLISDTGLRTFGRSREKHVFLFEKVIIISKKTENMEGTTKRAKKMESYSYKEHLDMTAITLRECESPLAFALSLHKQSREYKFDAQSKDVQNMWVSEIRRLLHLQFAMLKMQREKASFTPPSQRRVINTNLITTVSGSCERINSSASTESPTKPPSQSDVFTGSPPQMKKGKSDTSFDKSRNSRPHSSPPTSPPPSPPKSPPIKEPHPYEIPFQHQQKNLQEEKAQGVEPAAVKPSLRPERKSLPATTRPKSTHNGKRWSNVLSREALHVDNSVEQAVTKVRSKDLDTAWCVCGYHDNCELIVLGKGEGPLEELKQHLYDDRIAFGLLKVVEVVDEMPRPRVVYIEWIGVKSRLKDKATVTTHRPQLEKLFKPYHAGIFVTSHSDISERIIMDKVTNISGSKSHVV